MENIYLKGNLIWTPIFKLHRKFVKLNKPVGNICSFRSARHNCSIRVTESNDFTDSESSSTEGFKIRRCVLYLRRRRGHKINNFPGPRHQSYFECNSLQIFYTQAKFFSICLGFLQQKHSLVSARDEDQLVCKGCSDCTVIAIHVFGDSDFQRLTFYTEVKF